MPQEPAETKLAALLDACEKADGTEWCVVKDERGGDALDAVRRGCEGLEKLGRA